MGEKKRYLYTILDVLAEECGPVFEAVSDPVAARQFRRIMEPVSMDMRSDYKLYRVAEFDYQDSETMMVGQMIFAYDTPQLIITDLEVGK